MMKILILTVGKEKNEFLQDAIANYTLRILRYVPMEWVSIPHDTTKEKEGEKILQSLKKEDYLVLLDERGKDLKSEHLAELVETRMIDGVKRLVFLIGGAYGVSDKIHARANYTWKLSSLVFPHVIVRLIVVEQLYRAMTILRGEQYHHE